MEQPVDPTITLETCGPVSCCDVLPPAAADGACPCGANNNCPDPNELQGDIFVFPKKVEAFIFFNIKDILAFKEALRNFEPTSAADVVNNLKCISEAKCDAKDGEVPLLPIVQQQIGFNRTGLDLLGLSEKTGEDAFDRNNNPLLEQYHSLVIITACDSDGLEKAVKAFLELFNGAIDNVLRVDGKRRPGKLEKHEHFGFRDGISQPAMRGLTCPLPGQLEVDAGVILVGYAGDPLFDKRPEWARGGTFMVYRRWEQDVEGFNNYLVFNGKRWREFVPPVPLEPGETLTDEQGAELFGARLFGRFKSGAPLAITPVFDNPQLAEDKYSNNNFDYTAPGTLENSEKYCPFTSHIRKVNPRNPNSGLSIKEIEAAAIVRTSIAYGDELPDPNPRGLQFVCYQSSPRAGFYDAFDRFAMNENFPPCPPKKHGVDGIMGSMNVPKLGVVCSHDPLSALPQHFITLRAGEDFFVPSIPTLKYVAQMTTMCCCC